MWDKLKAAAQHPTAQLVKRICGDPVQLYAVFLVMTCMYYYHEDWTWLYTLVTVGVSFVLMRFYDFVARKGFLGSISYLAFLFAGLYGVNMLVTLGQRSYPITFLVWFLTPQDVVDFSMIYTLSIYLLMTGFLTSTVYYFAKVRYRMTMQFLIMLIPLSLYAKEGRQMPALLVILLLSSFFLLMVYCRQLRESLEIRNLHGFQNGVSVAIYVVAFSILAAIIPKPAFKADREFIENAMSYSSWSDILMSTISMFMDTTDNRAPTANSGMTLYYVNAQESLRLATQTFTYYEENDSWTTVKKYDKPNAKPSDPLTYKPQALLQTILDIAAAYPDFAQEYGLSEVAGSQLPEQKAYELYISPRYTGFQVLPAPTRTYSLENSDLINLSVSDTSTFQVNPGIRNFVMYYYPDTYARSAAVSEILNRLDRNVYGNLLSDAMGLTEADGNEEAHDMLMQAFVEWSDAYLFLWDTQELDWQSDVIDKLAAELTKDLDSDLEKAIAIERYFVNEGYVYDAAYEKAIDENVVDFLTDTHKGVCYEYATAMVLLCRSAGLPARYAQGYNMSELYDGNSTSPYNPNGRETNYVIKARNAHAFPQVYISGYGWLSFEPTVPSDEEMESAAENLKIMRLGYVLLVLAVLVFLLWLMLPYIRERRFRRSLKRMPVRQCASAMFRRMRQQLHLTESVTVTELAEQSAPFFQKEVLFRELDALLYQPDMTAEPQREELAEAYIWWQTERKQYEKEQRKKKREKRRNAL